MTQSILERYPQVRANPMAMAMLCTELLNRQLYDDAFSLGVAAASAAPHDMAVRDLVSSTLGRGVPKWHVPMLHDLQRNDCYAEALRRIVRPGMTILEIGSGAGFLSLIAARLGANVYTCEANPVVAAAAKFIALRNGLSHRIHVIPKLSSHLEIGVDLPRKADLLMSELFDDTLFGDGIISYIREARERFLMPDAAVVPQHAELRLRLVTFNLPTKHQPLARIAGFDLSPFNVLAPRSSSYLRAAKLGALPLSEPISALAKNFSEASPFGRDVDDVKLRSYGGAATGISQWLRIRFSDDLVFENDPEQSPASHWGSPVTIFDRERPTSLEEEVRVRVRRFGREILYDMSTNLEPYETSVRVGLGG